MIYLHSSGTPDVAAAGVVTLDPVQVGILVAAVIAIAWGVREWYYGGSVLRVSFELGRTDGKVLLHTFPVDFIDPQTLNRRFEWRLEGPTIDVAVITVSNRGRTPATILAPGLAFTSKGAEELRVSGTLVAGSWGEQEHRVRIEAHDSRAFVFVLQPMVDVAEADVRFQTPQGSNEDLWARAVVTSGTGKIRRSPKRVWTAGKWHARKWVSGRWKVRTPLVQKPTDMEKLLVEYFLPRVAFYDQLLGVARALQAAETEDGFTEAYPELSELYGPINSMALLMAAQMLKAETGSAAGDPERKSNPDA